VQKTKRLFITALFSSIIFVINFFVPPPISYLLIVVQAVLLALSNFFCGKSGRHLRRTSRRLSVRVGTPCLWSNHFCLHASLWDYGGRFFFCLQNLFHKGGVKRNRVIFVMTFSTAIIGFLSYYTTAVYLQLVDLNLMMSGLVIFVATGSGIASGYAAAYLWNKYLKNISV